MNSFFVSKFAKKVYVVHRREDLRASKVMQDRCFKNEKIEFLFTQESSSINYSIAFTACNSEQQVMTIILIKDQNTIRKAMF